MKYLFVIIITCLFSCQQNKNQTVSKLIFPPGGLDYPETVAEADSHFFIYQYKDSMSRLDSFNTAEYGNYFLGQFHEPNLSIHPQEQIVFRLIYDRSMRVQPIIISLTETQIIVKQRIKGWPYRHFDIEKLSDQEQEQVMQSQRYFSVTDEWKKAPDRRKYLDSLFKVFPDMDNPVAYKALLEKVADCGPEPFQYSTKIISISEKTFYRLMTLINESGFWSMIREPYCKNVATDTDMFSFEANTPYKYKITQPVVCDEEYIKFSKACQEIVDCAGLGNEIRMF